jgi:hypothetical protein
VSDRVPARVWRLTRPQIVNTLTAAFGATPAAARDLPAEPKPETTFSTYATLSPSSLLVESLARIAEEVGSAAASRAKTIVTCPEGAGDAGACVRRYIEATGRKVWRRALTDDERTRLTAIYARAAASGDSGLGLKAVTKALVLSPSFLFRTELGGAPRPDGLSELGDDELASALAFLVTDGPPDAALMDLAAAGKLDPLVKTLRPEEAGVRAVRGA